MDQETRRLIRNTIKLGIVIGAAFLIGPKIWSKVGDLGKSARDTLMVIGLIELFVVVLVSTDFIDELIERNFSHPESRTLKKDSNIFHLMERIWYVFPLFGSMVLFLSLSMVFSLISANATQSNRQTRPIPSQENQISHEGHQPPVATEVR